MRDLPRIHDENVLVGYETSDDAGVYRLNPECALVQTVDFFTPIVDDPFTFGAIAAVNSLSDVYAMGGRPLSALSMVCFPAKGDFDVLRQILAGGISKMREARCPILGGHSVADDEIKFGYSITGTVHPQRIWTNAGALPGDVLLFTKQIGTGILSTALKRGMANEAQMAAVTESMLTLNREAAEALEGLEVHACTDVTGFGLIGHAREMALPANVTLEIDHSLVPIFPGVLEFSAQGAHPGGLKNNREFASCDVEYARDVAVDIDSALYDPQTSGGLLLSLTAAAAAVFQKRFDRAQRIGQVTERGAKAIRIL